MPKRGIALCLEVLNVYRTSTGCLRKKGGCIVTFLRHEGRNPLPKQRVQSTASQRLFRNPSAPNCVRTLRSASNRPSTWWPSWSTTQISGWSRERRNNSTDPILPYGIQVTVTILAGSFVVQAERYPDSRVRVRFSE